MFDDSIKRAEAVLGGLNGRRVFVAKVSEGDCHCFHCWPETWAAVNEYLADRGPIADEGDLLISSDGGDMVLECHESGPEVVAFLNATTAVAALAAAVTSLVTAIVSARRREAPERASRIRLKVASGTRGLIDQTTMIEVELPAAVDVQRAIAQEVDIVIRSRT